MPYVLAGPRIGLFFSGNEYYSGDSYEVKESIPDTAISLIDIAAEIGAGLSLDIGSGTLLIFDASYSWSFLNLIKTRFEGFSSVNSRDIRLAAGILFPLN